MIIEFDIDNTIVTQGRPGRYNGCKPIPDAIKIVNQLYDLGHIIIFNSARHWKCFALTYDQLKKFGFKFHSLILGKICADIVVDDRSIGNIDDLTIEVFEKAVKKVHNRKIKKQKEQEVLKIRAKIYHTE